MTSMAQEEAKLLIMSTLSVRRGHRPNAKMFANAKFVTS
jgi:hypothetical protein